MIAPRTIGYRGTVFTDFDAPAAIASGAEVVLVDGLAHATADHTRQRWQDVADVLHAGLDVVTTMNVAQLASVRDYAARITGVGTGQLRRDDIHLKDEAILTRSSSAWSAAPTPFAETGGRGCAGVRETSACGRAGDDPS